jgi:hypothetical protein
LTFLLGCKVLIVLFTNTRKHGSSVIRLFNVILLTVSESYLVSLKTYNIREGKKLILNKGPFVPGWMFEFWITSATKKERATT